MNLIQSEFVNILNDDMLLFTYIYKIQLEQLKERQKSVIEVRFKINKLELRAEYLIRIMD